MKTQSLPIRSAQGNYSVHFHPHLASILESLTGTPGFEKSIILCDQRVAHLYKDALAPLFKALPTLLIEATEEEKTWEGVGRILTQIQGLNSTKQTRVIAIGGGIIQDIASFVSHIYYRGLEWHFVPTTLLSMSDSCIGAKSGINLGKYKNQIGTFHSPKTIHIATGFIETLTDGDVLSGYGEVFKLALVDGQTFFERIDTLTQNTPLREMPWLELIRSSLETKKKIIEEDEYELNIRRILNFGHTFGHALETITAHEIPHGAAVAWGIDVVNFIAHKRGLLPSELYGRLHQFIASNFATKLSQEISCGALISAARRDKKVADGQINLVLLESFGRLKVVKTPFDAVLTGEVTEYITHHSPLTQG